MKLDFSSPAEDDANDVARQADLGVVEDAADEVFAGFGHGGGGQGAGVVVGAAAVCAELRPAHRTAQAAIDGQATMSQPLLMKSAFT